MGIVGAPAAEAKTCANTYGGDVIGAYNMRCSKARDVVRTWAVRYKRDGKYNRTVLRFGCRKTVQRYEGIQMICRRGEKKVLFYPNVPR